MERPYPFFHVNVINVYLGKQGEETMLLLRLIRIVCLALNSYLNVVWRSQKHGKFLLSTKAPSAPHSQAFVWTNFNCSIHRIYSSKKEQPLQAWFVAECLSTRLLILQSVFLVGSVCPQLLYRFSNAICVQTSIPFRNAIRRPVYKGYVHLRKFIISSTAAPLAVSLSRHRICGESEKELEHWCENGSKAESQNAATIHREVHGEIHE